MTLRSPVRRLFLASVACALLTSLVVMVPATATAKLPPPRGATVRGTVYLPGDAGPPLPGAVVTAYALPGDTASCPEGAESWQALSSVRTSRDGTYSLAVPAGTYRLGVQPPDLSAAAFGYRVDAVADDDSNVTSWVGFADDVIVPANGRAGVDVRLSTSRLITGTVEDATSAVPLAGVEVRAVTEQAAQIQRGAFSDLTDASGSYAILGLPDRAPDPVPSTSENEALRYGLSFRDTAGWHQLWLWWWTGLDPDGLNDTPVVDLSTESHPVRDVVLRPTGRDTGVVTDGRGKPLAGIEVRPGSAFPYPPLFTDARGRYAVESGYPLRFLDPAGRHRTTHAGGFQYEAQAVAADPTLTTPLPPSEERASTVVLLPGASIVGTAVFAAQVPASGATIEVWQPGYVHDWTRTLGGSTVRCDGTFALTGLWPGPYTITFEPRGQFDPATTRTATVPSAGMALDIGQVLLPAWIVRGSVSGPDGALAGIEVSLTGTDYRWARAVTNEWGQFWVFTPYEDSGSQLLVHDPDRPWLDQVVPVWDDDPWDSLAQWVQVLL